MPSKKKKYNARFPAGRIKKIMQTDEEVGKVAQAVPIIISRTLELFVESLLKKAMQITNAKNAKTLTTSHMKQCILSESRFDFLKELVVNIPDISANDESTETAAPEPDINIIAAQNSLVQPNTSTVTQHQLRKPVVLENKTNKTLSTASTAIDLSVKAQKPAVEQIITPNFYKEIPSQLETTVTSPVKTSVIQYSPKVTATKHIKHSVDNIISKSTRPSKVARLSLAETSVARNKTPQFHIDLSSPVYNIDRCQASNITPNVNISSASSHETPILHFDFSNATFGKPPPPLIPITHNNPVHINLSNTNTPASNITIPNIASGISENLDEDYDT